MASLHKMDANNPDSIQNNKVLTKLDELAVSHARLEVAYPNIPEEIRKAILSAIHEHTLLEQHRGIGLDISHELEERRERDNRALRDILTSTSNLLRESRKLDRVLNITNSLRFKAIDYRHLMVSETHDGTFQWLLKSTEPSIPSFPEWIASPHCTYWITGKPGSGKSTLMKFLCHNEAVRKALHDWAGENSLCIASFFFWHSGSDLQRSQQGLLRTLLYHILRQCPDLIPDLVPDRWHACRPEGYPRPEDDLWSLSDLTAAFKRIKRLEQCATRFCFFVDGLDEYEGDHSDIISTINDLASGFVKICFSSRPWNVFEEAYGDNGAFKLRIHNFTHRDILLYISDQLEKDSRFVQLSKLDSQYHDLVAEIAEKAEGVFLWVYLVVRSFRKGFSNADTISDLRRRLQALPTDLVEYYRYMYLAVDDVYREQASRIFSICLTADYLPLSILSFFDEDDPRFALGTSGSEWSHYLTDRALSTLARRINARCQDLIEVRDLESDPAKKLYSVDFIHRTARDFLDTEDMKKLLRNSAGSFDPYQYRCQAGLAQMKLLRMRDFDEDNLRVTIKELLFNVTALSNQGTTIDIDLVDEIYSIVLTAGQHIPREMKLQRLHIFLSSALKCNVEEFVRHRGHDLVRAIGVQYSAEKDHYDLPLLGTALAHSSVDTVRLLLECGSSPNASHETSAAQSRGSKTLWAAYLLGLNLNRAIGADILHEIAQKLELCIEYGADTRILTTYKDENTGKKVTISFIDLVNKSLLPTDAARLRKILKNQGHGGEEYDLVCNSESSKERA